MTNPNAEAWELLAELPLDDQDAAVLAGLAAVYDSLDPMPAGLVERLQFAVSLDALNAELAELQVAGELAGARGGEVSEVKTLTFTSDALTTMVTISAAGPDRVRIDGWIAPAQEARVELRQVAVSRTVTADSDGRFVFDDVPHGLSRFLVRVAVASSRPPVITPAVEL
ncbi:MAG: hypothetical protein JWO63_3387 [Frankiales bacterium]|jgi:hypothetical protein|nr:hypothetical protein [Frankiales bacterium]